MAKAKSPAAPAAILTFPFIALTASDGKPLYVRWDSIYAVHPAIEGNEHSRTWISYGSGQHMWVRELTQQVIDLVCESLAFSMTLTKGGR